MRFTRRWSIGVLLGTLALLPAGARPAEDPPREPDHRLIVGWDDAVICCGPGTEAGMDSPEGVRRMVRRWRARGIKGLYWRVNESQLPDPDRFVVRNRPAASPPSNHLMARHDRVFRSFDLIGTVREAAEAEGMELWAWYPTVYSSGAPAEGPGFTTAWQIESRFGREHPEVLSVDREGNRHFMVWEYAYPEARAAKVREFVAFAKERGLRRFVACLRTEAGQMQPPPLHADQFGFNPPVVEEMKRRHGVDILTDRRFDFRDPARDPMDPMVENWRRLRGEYLTLFYRELRKALDGVAPGIEIAVQVPGDRVGSCLGNWTLDWRTWVDEGLVQEIVAGVPLDDHIFASTEAAPGNRGYLPCAVSVETVREFVRGSRHPEVRVIAPGGPAADFGRPPAGADGWRLDGWFDLWIHNWWERWEQWRGDLREFGHVNFLVQDFDGPDVDRDRCDGGFGDVAHRPDLRACPGFWHPVGGPESTLPRLQSRDRWGAAGRAMRITRDAAGGVELHARHDGRHDRSGYPFPGDTAVSTGTCEVDFRVRRDDPDSSLVAYVQYDAAADARHEVGLYLHEGGVVRFPRDGSWATSKAALRHGAWHRVSIAIDLEARTWSAAVFPEGRERVEVCRDVPYRARDNAFNHLVFAPQGGDGSTCCIDEVSWRWKPSAVPASPGRKVLVEEGFEGAEPGTPLRGVPPPKGGAWSVEAGAPGDLAVDADLSLGDRFRSLRIRGGGGRATLSPEGLRRGRGAAILLDADVLLRGDSPVVWLLPIGSAATEDRTTMAVVERGTGRTLAGIRAAGGAWECWNGEGYAPVPTPAAVDAWTRVHLRIDGAGGTWAVILQVVGEAPREAFRGRTGAGIPDGAPLDVVLETVREVPRPDGPAFDNLVLSTE